jgi:ABC-type phosphate/phosphonate transport system substrate-binding protein
MMRLGEHAAWRGLLFGFLFLIGLKGVHAQEVNPVIRVGFSAKAFIGVNENDAKAATKVWAQTIAKERNVSVDPVAQVFRKVEEMRDALREKTVDAVVLSTLEYFSLDLQMQPVKIVSLIGEPSERYMLLVHKDSGISDLSGLRGKSLNMQESFRSSLALIWMDTQLMQQGIGPTNRFMGKVQALPKASAAILPVFFRQVDACLVSSGAFATMVELNPQLAKNLRILAESPQYISAFFAFRRDLAPNLRLSLQTAMLDLEKTAGGAQILALFQGGGALSEKPLSVLDSARDLLAQHARLSRGKYAGSAGDSSKP